MPTWLVHSKAREVFVLVDQFGIDHQSNHGHHCSQSDDVHKAIDDDPNEKYTGSAAFLLGEHGPHALQDPKDAECWILRFFLSSWGALPLLLFIRVLRLRHAVHLLLQFTKH